MENNYNGCSKFAKKKLSAMTYLRLKKFSAVDEMYGMERSFNRMARSSSRSRFKLPRRYFSEMVVLWITCFRVESFKEIHWTTDQIHCVIIKMSKQIWAHRYIKLSTFGTFETLPFTNVYTEKSFFTMTEIHHKT